MNFHFQFVAVVIIVIRNGTQSGEHARQIARLVEIELQVLELHFE